MNLSWERIVYTLPAIIIALAAHEYCHAFAAYKLGDETAKKMGRLTLNPIKHIDLIGLVFIIIAGFGWAKPVVFDPHNLKNYRRDKALIAAAGPLANFILALVFAAFIRIWTAFIFASLSSKAGADSAHLALLFSRPFIIAITFLERALMINLGLFVFNLLPIPPLDGSHIVFSGLNLAPETEHNIMKIGMPVLFVVMIIQNQTGITILPIGYVINAIARLLFPMSG